MKFEILPASENKESFTEQPLMPGSFLLELFRDIASIDILLFHVYEYFELLLMFLRQWRK